MPASNMATTTEMPVPTSVNNHASRRTGNSAAIGADSSGTTTRSAGKLLKME
jgi:hypothetical protein